MKLTWTAEAIADRHAIYDYIEADNPRAALALDGLIASKAALLPDNPRIGKPGRVPGTRELLVHRHYLLVYRQREDTLCVLRVLHAARRWPPERG